jgi:hypothetical protein
MEVVPLPHSSNGKGMVYPEKQLDIDSPQIIRDYRVVRFQFFPVQYFPERNEIRITQHAVVTIRKVAPHGKNEKDISRERISPIFSRIYRSSILNFDFVKRYPSDTVLYVIITPDVYYDDMLPFVEWKEEQGIMVELVKFTDIAPNPTYVNIRNFMEDAYFTWSHPPDYFLAVGDAGVFPIKYSVDAASYGTYANDNYYVALDSINDIFPDICGGRLPVQNSFQLETMINKIINYEKNPYMGETSWYRKAVMVSSDEYPSQPETKVWIRERFMEFGFDYVDSLYARNYSNAFSMRADINNAVNQGRGFLNYRGPGWYYGWNASFGQIYDISHVQSLINGRKLPIATSLGCGVAKFDEGNCFAEQWVRNGTPTSEKGAVSFFGATWITHTRHNNKMDKGIYKGFLQEGLTSFGEATVRGKIYMYNICGMSDTTITEMNEYLILGDPALLAKTDIPESMMVVHDSIVPIGESVLWVLVTDNQGSVPNAFVCAKMDSHFHVSGYTDSTGSIGMTIFPTIVDTVVISVVEKNHFPYRGYCLVNADGPWPGYYCHYIDDDTFETSYGDGDSIPDCGELIELPVVLKNYGNQDVNNVSGILTSTDSFVIITDSTELFGNIPAGDSSISQDDYDVTISAVTPDCHSVLLQLELTDGNDTWTSHFKIDISAPHLSYVKHTVYDTTEPIPNGILDPGETVELTCILVNEGTSIAPGVTAILRSGNSFVTCIDSTSDYGDLEPFEEREGTPFVATADSATPVGTPVYMTFIFSTSLGHCDSITFLLKIGVGGDFLIWDPDENHSSGPKIKDALESSGYKGDYSTQIYDYLDILGAYRAIFICLGVWPNNCVLTDGYIVDSLCQFLDEGGRIYMEGADTWAFDQPTNLHSYFHIIGLHDGTDDTYTKLGISGGSYIVFNNVSPYYINGIAYYAGTYKTVGTSFEFGGLSDGLPPSTKAVLADSIMRFFGIMGTREENLHNKFPRVFSLSKNAPNPFNARTAFVYTVPLYEHENPAIRKLVSVKIYDVIGRVVRTLLHSKKLPGTYTIVWDGRGDRGVTVSQGVYFTRLTLEKQGLSRTRKIVLLK